MENNEKYPDKTRRLVCDMSEYGLKAGDLIELDISPTHGDHLDVYSCVTMRLRMVVDLFGQEIPEKTRAILARGGRRWASR